MAEEDNLVIRMLREIRGDTTDLRHRMTRVERKLDEVQEGIGMAAQARVSTETQGENIDLLRDEIDALKRRVTELEARP